MHKKFQSKKSFKKKKKRNTGRMGSLGIGAGKSDKSLSWAPRLGTAFYSLSLSFSAHAHLNCNKKDEGLLIRESVLLFNKKKKTYQRRKGGGGHGSFAVRIEFFFYYFRLTVRRWKTLLLFPPKYRPVKKKIKILDKTDSISFSSDKREENKNLLGFGVGL